MQKSAFIKGLGVVVVIAAVLIVLPGNLLEIYSHTRFIVVPESMASSTTRIFYRLQAIAAQSPLMHIKKSLWLIVLGIGVKCMIQLFSANLI